MKENKRQINAPVELDVEKIKSDRNYFSWLQKIGVVGMTGSMAACNLSSDINVKGVSFFIFLGTSFMAVGGTTSRWVIDRYVNKESKAMLKEGENLSQQGLNMQRKAEILTEQAIMLRKAIGKNDH